MRRLPERLRARVREVLGAGERPGRLAAAWALGVGIGLSPLLGLHTVLALIAALLLRLNKVDVLLGTLVINPWTLPLYVPAAVYLGTLVTGIHVKLAAMPDLGRLAHISMWKGQAALLKPWLVTWGTGASLIALVVGTLTYFALRRLIEHHRLRHEARGLRREA